jgi:pyochelin biosynthesis protein PchC
MDNQAAWIRCFHPRPDAPVRLVCFPHAGGSASVFQPWAEAFGPEIELLAVQYPGRQDRYREPLHESLTGLADLAAPAVRAAVGKGRYALFGHSMGATLAFEVARRLQREHGPELLVVSGRRAPSLFRAEEGDHLLDDATLTARLQQLSGTDPRLLDDPEARQMILPSVRSDLRAIETYRCPESAQVDAPVLTLTGDRDPWTTTAEAAAWSGHTTNRFDLRVYPGAHFFVADHRPAIADLVSSRLSPVSARI